MRLSLILPTYNEAANLPDVLQRVHAAVLPFEVIVVDDDSPDKTWEVAEKLRDAYPHMRVVRRIGAKGLSSAVMAGFDAAKGSVFVVMDSDLQHNPSLIPLLAGRIEDGAGLAVASRYRQGGGVGKWAGVRRFMSAAATFLVQKIPNVRTSDPMSGFFAIDAELYHGVRPRLVPEGFKILLELLAAVPKHTRLDEVPLQFRPRARGESKLSLWVKLQFLKQSLRLALRKIGLTGPRLFAGIVVVLTVLFLLRAWSLRRLYLDASMRSAVSTQIRDVAAAKGWFLSDIEIVSVGVDGTLRLVHRPHVRGRDVGECWIVPSTGEPVPCAS